MTRRFAIVALLIASGCKRAEALPEDLDTLISSYWLEFMDAADDRVAALSYEVPNLVDTEALLDSEERGAPSRLTQEHLDILEFYAEPGGEGEGVVPDPELAAPMMTTTRFACTADQLGTILSFPDQNALYESYEDYNRVFVEDHEAFAAGDIDSLSWEGFIHVKNGIVGEYTETFRSDMRRVSLEAQNGLAASSMYMVRTWIPFPGTFQQPERSFTQDYQLEVFVPMEGGDYVHLYPIWREMDYGLIGTTESAAVQSVTMAQMVDWDKNTAKLCEEGRP